MNPLNRRQLFGALFAVVALKTLPTKPQPDLWKHKEFSIPFIYKPTAAQQHFMLDRRRRVWTQC